MPEPAEQAPARSGPGQDGASPPAGRPPAPRFERRIGPVQASIVITRYAESRRLLQDTLDSLLRQTGGPFEILVLDQQDDPELWSWLKTQPGRHALRGWTIPPRGLSVARNHGVAWADAERILFLDADALATRDWAQILASALDAPGVVIAGGRILPRFEGPRPRWAGSLLVREQWSLLDLGPGRHDTAKVIGCAFALRRDRLGEAEPFDSAHGRRDGNLQGGEETELCRRVRARGQRVLYVGDAVVAHRILPDRLTLGWIQRRLWWAGFSRARQGGRPAANHRLPWSELAWLPFILPAYALGYAAGRFIRH